MDRGVIPPEHWTPWEYVSQVERDGERRASRPEVLDKELCQGVALRKWAEDRSIRIAQMADDPEILRTGNGALYEKATRMNWLREVAPVEVRNRPGRPSKRRDDKSS